MKKYFGILMILALLAAPTFADSQADAEISVTVDVKEYAEISFDDEILTINVDDREVQNETTKMRVLANFDHDIQMTGSTDSNWQKSELSGTDYVLPFLVNGAGENGDLTLAYVAHVHKGDTTSWGALKSPAWQDVSDEEATISFKGDTPGTESLYTLRLRVLMDESYNHPGNPYSGKDTLAIADTYAGALTFTLVPR